jgi:hypothetical protein
MNDPSRVSSGLTVRKRDGHVEPFSIAKVVESLRRCLQETHDPDPRATAVGMAEALIHFLGEQIEDGPIPSARVADLIEAVLTQTGYAAAAMAFVHGARRRHRLRRGLHVVHFRDAEGRYVNRRWSKSTVVASLQKKHGLSFSTARRIAGEIEAALFRSGLLLVTTGLIREMVVSELLAWGLADEALAAGPAQERPKKSPR